MGANDYALPRWHVSADVGRSALLGSKLLIRDNGMAFVDSIFVEPNEKPF